MTSAARPIDERWGRRGLVRQY